MCERCDARANDPRRNAFFSATSLEIVAQEEIDKTQNDDGTFPGLAPMADVKIFADASRAKFESFRLMNLDAVAAVKPSQQTLCLN